MYHSIFPQVCTVVTKHSITLDPTTNQSAYATHSNTPPHYSKSPPFVNPSPPSTIPKKPPPPNNVLRTLQSAQPNHPPPPSKLEQPKLQDRELKYAVPVREVHRGRQENVPREATKPMSSFMQNASKKPPDPLCNFPLYDKVDPDQPVVVEPLLPRQSGVDNDMWAQFKFPLLPMPESYKQAKVDEHVYDEIGDKYLPPVEWREVSVMKEFIYKLYFYNFNYMLPIKIVKNADKPT